MRTTVTLDPDVETMVKRLMRDRGLSFKEAVNHAIRSGLAATPPAKAFSTPTFRMGFDPSIPWDRALSLAGELEDDELIRRLAARK
ncbi:MAG TPA: CopG family transcriptional regulator [Acidimicrobiales bacterium]|nr:CopG family transcriptional regulator [Acidimicrobiales bacterium]